MGPTAFASNARTRRFRGGGGGGSGRRKVGFRKLLGMTASRDHFALQFVCSIEIFNTDNGDRGDEYCRFTRNA